MIGVLLSGGNQDGGEGIKNIHQAGGYTMVEDPAKAKFNAMPESALERIKPDCVADLYILGSQLMKIANLCREEK